MIEIIILNVAYVQTFLKCPYTFLSNLEIEGVIIVTNLENAVS